MNLIVLVCASVLPLAVIGCSGITASSSSPSKAVGREAAKTVESAVLQEMARDGSLIPDCAGESVVGQEVVSLRPIDLNGDGQSEYEVSGNPGCACIGARRCAKWIYQRTPEGYRQILEMVQPDEGIGVRKTRTDGYSDLEVVGWAGDEALREVFRFDGRKYRSMGLEPL